MTSTLAFGQSSVSESSMVMGKYFQRERESFLKSPTVPSTVNTPAVMPSSVAESNMVTGKYFQRERESFLKPKPTTSEGTIVGKELEIPKEIPQIQKETSPVQIGSEK